MTARPFTPSGSSLSGLYAGPSQPDTLVLFLHGYGANAADLMGIGRQLASHLPKTGFLAPDAPKTLPFGAQARAWFDLDARLDPADLDRGVQAARPLVLDYLSAALRSFDLRAQNLLVCGFSQGCMMALEACPRFAQPVGQVMGLSGALAGPDRLTQEVVSRSPIFLGHGTADPVVPFAAQALAQAALTKAGFGVEVAAYAGVGHGIPPEAIRTLYDKVLSLGLGADHE